MEGLVFNTNNSGNCVVVNYTNYDDVTVKFVETGYETKTRMDNLKLGKVKDYLHPSIYGKGILGEGFKQSESQSYSFQLWKNMLKRCYSEVSFKKSPSYEQCLTSETFNDYQQFKTWCNRQLGFGNTGWELDKDILVKGNKIYSEDTCCFVPKEINLLLVKHDKGRGDYLLGVDYHKNRKQFRARCSDKHLGWFNTEIEAFHAYKHAKEAYIKELANKWKDQIDPRVYDALIKYEVEITD